MLFYFLPHAVPGRLLFFSSLALQLEPPTEAAPWFFEMLFTFWLFFPCFPFRCSFPLLPMALTLVSVTWSSAPCMGRQNYLSLPKTLSIFIFFQGLSLDDFSLQILIFLAPAQGFFPYCHDLIPAFLKGALLPTALQLFLCPLCSAAQGDEQWHLLPLASWECSKPLFWKLAESVM